MDRRKAEQGRGREKRLEERRVIRRARVRRKKMEMRENVGKSPSTVFFQWFGAPEGRKVGSLKRRVRSQLARGEMKNCTPLWREAHFQVKMYKTASDHFWKFRCRESARHCGAKHISKSKCTKHPLFALLLEIQISKKCTPLWREAQFEVKMLKAPGVRTTLGGSDVASLRFGSLHYTIHSTTLHYITLHYTPQHYNYNYRTTQLHSTTLHYTPLR